MRPASRWVKQQSRQSENRNEPTLVPQESRRALRSLPAEAWCLLFPRCQSIGNTDLENLVAAFGFAILNYVFPILLVNISLGFGPRRARGVVE